MWSREQTWIDVTQECIASLVADRDRLDVEQNELSEQIVSLQKKIELYQRTLDDFQHQNGRPTTPNDDSVLIPLVMAGLPLRRVYEYLAGLNGGVAVCTSIARQMLARGLATTYESALATVHSTLHRAAKKGDVGWVKVGSGRYRFSGSPVRVETRIDPQTDDVDEVAFSGSVELARVALTLTL